MKKIDLSLILPCYNEASHFTGSVAQILSSLSLFRYRYEVIFVDDGSSDNTKKLILAACKKYPQCRCLFHARNTGRGAAVSTGIRRAKAEIVGYMDIDCEVSPLYIPAFLQILKAGNADVVVGKRVYRTGLPSITRELLSVGYRTFAGYVLGTGGIDTESGYKFFNRKTFLPVMKRIHSRGWFWDTESIVLSQKAGLRVVEVPVLFLRRTDKQSTVRIVQDSWDYLKNVWGFYRRHKKEERTL